jgi:hypothetical protein
MPKILRYCALLSACGRTAPGAAPPSPLETEIARELTARAGGPVTVTCAPRACRAELPDRTVLPIRVAEAGSAWTWQVEGLVVDTPPIAAYVDGVLADLHVAKTASCGAKLQLVPRGERLACTLSGGGTAFVEIASNGAISVELALDSGAAAARGEPSTPERDRELDKMSRALVPSAETDEP